MTIWIILFVVSISLIAVPILLEEYISEGIGIFSAGAGMLTTAILLILTFLGVLFTPYNHIQDLESIEYHQDRIEIHQQRINRLTSVLTTFDYPEATLLNADSPVASVVQQIGDSELAIANAKKDLSETKKDIRARKRWIFAWTTKLVE